MREREKTREKGKILRNRERRGWDVEMGESTEAHQPKCATHHDSPEKLRKLPEKDQRGEGFA